MGELKEWVDSLRELQVIQGKIDKYGIVRLRHHDVPEDKFGPEAGVWYFAEAFLKWRKRDRNVKVVLRDFGSDMDVLFVATFGDGSRDTIHPIEVLYIDDHPYTGVVMEGGLCIKAKRLLFVRKFPFRGTRRRAEYMR